MNTNTQHVITGHDVDLAVAHLRAAVAAMSMVQNAAQLLLASVDAMAASALAGLEILDGAPNDEDQE